MRIAEVLRNGERVGVLKQHHSHLYEFIYDDAWFENPNRPSVSLTMPKTQKVYTSEHLFPYFFNMLSEGVNRTLQIRQFQLDEDDHFGLLLQIAQHETIGAITVKPLDPEKI